MRTTVNIDDDLQAGATQLAGPMGRSAILAAGLGASIEHQGAPGMLNRADLLERGLLVMHPFVVGELAIPRRQELPNSIRSAATWVSLAEQKWVSFDERQGAWRIADVPGESTSRYRPVRDVWSP